MREQSPDSVIGACIPTLVEAAAHHSEVAKFLYEYSNRRRSALTDVFRQGIQDGELPAHLDPELEALALSGPVFYRRLMTASPLAADDIPRLVRQVQRLQGTYSRNAGSEPSLAR